MASTGAGYIPLVKSKVLYLGSSIPLETSIGLESVQQPLRERYGGGGGDGKVIGIDAIVTVFSSGILMEYTEDPTASTWFPIQTLHVCCSVKPVREGYGLRFVQIDSPEAENSRDPPIFAAITRRAKGIKVLECHGFICKTTETALAFVQSCTHAFQHKEGWLNEAPPVERLKQTATRLIPAEKVAGAPRPQVGFTGQAKQYTLETTCNDMQSMVVTLPVAPKLQQQPQQPPIQPQPPPPQPQQPPPPQQQPPQQAQQPLVQLMPQLITQITGTTNGDDKGKSHHPHIHISHPPMPMNKGYFANWRDSADQSVMIVPESPFYSQTLVIEQEEKKKKKKKKKKKNKKQKEKVEYTIIRKSNRSDSSKGDTDDDDDDDDDDDGNIAVIYPDGRVDNGNDDGGDMMYYPKYDMGSDPYMDSYADGYDYSGYDQYGYDPYFAQNGYDPYFAQGGYDPYSAQGGYDPYSAQGGYDPYSAQGGYYPNYQYF